METDKEKTKALFIKFSENNCSPEERRQLLDYLEDSPQPDAIPAVEEVLANGLPEKMTETEAMDIFNAITHPPKVRLLSSKWARVAAFLIPIISLLSLYFFNRTNKRELVEFANESAVVKKMQLPDGTTIHLNQYSRVKIDKYFSDNTRREVWLKGEAFFQVEKSADNPFLVHADEQVVVQVLGTSFNVNTNKGNPIVILNSGSVKLSSKTTPSTGSVTLLSGEKGTFNAAKGSFTREMTDTLYYTSWKYNLLAFKATPLPEVFQQLEAKYRVTFVIQSNDIKEQLFSGYLPSNNLEQALSSIEQAFNLTTKFRNQQIYVNNNLSHPVK